MLVSSNRTANLPGVLFKKGKCSMKAITREWLDRAQDDLNAAHALLNYPDLTPADLSRFAE
jgi:hypothetical protein